jgi:hypothetical protein
VSASARVAADRLVVSRHVMRAVNSVEPVVTDLDHSRRRPPENPPHTLPRPEPDNARMSLTATPLLRRAPVDRPDWRRALRLWVVPPRTTRVTSRSSIVGSSISGFGFRPSEMRPYVPRRVTRSVSHVCPRLLRNVEPSPAENSSIVSPGNRVVAMAHAGWCRRLVQVLVHADCSTANSQASAKPRTLARGRKPR